MDLDLALRDLHEGVKGGPEAPAVKIEGQIFGKQDVVVDNHSFRRCTFLKSTLWFAGGPCQFTNCQIDSETTIHLTGAAARGLALWDRLRKSREGDADWTPEA